ncbi:MAG: hypothetical protein FJX77_01205 [Armatimonadetes bacterium]|nr:hypothetical protein [Armatimonadota bacterium]
MREARRILVAGLALLLLASTGWGQAPEPQKLLFVDDHEVAASQGVTRVWHAARKANDAKPIRFWQRDGQGNRVPLKAAIYTSALYDPSRGLFRMWCRVFPGLKPGTALEGTESHRYMRYGYCESRDGIDFELVSELKGLHSNGDYNIVVTLDPHASDPQHRYKAGYDGAPPGFPNGACLAHSADGIQWTPYHDGKPVTGRAADFTNCVIWDNAARVYRLFTRTDYGTGGGTGEIRGMRMMTNPDVEKSPSTWKTERQWKLDREGPEEHRRRQIYTMTDWQYGGLHFGLCSIYEWPNDFSEGKTTDHVRRHERDVINTYLATSRDAVHWDLSAIYAGQPLIQRGGENAWDKDMVFPSSWMITRGQEHWIYYGGANERHGVAEIFQPKRDMAMGLAKLPLDRFAGLTAGDRPGTIVTKPFVLRHPRLSLNAATWDKGTIHVEVLTRDSRPVAGFGTAEARAIQGDALDHPIAWNGNRDVSKLMGKEIRLKFTLIRARLHAMTLSAGRRPRTP